MPTFWHIYIAAGTLLTIFFCGWLIAWSAKQGPQNKSDEETVGHVWDGDLEEWNNPLPRWWLYLFFITIFWGLGYLVAFPGLGGFKGLIGWSSTGQYEQEIAAARERYEPIYAEYAAMDWDALVRHPEARQLGASLYASYCTTCHGSDARGAKGFPNLADDNWQWGSSEQQMIATITNGRVAVMPVLTPALGGDEGVRNMVTYVRSLSGLVEADAAAKAMQPMFTSLCSACHMPDGSGNPALGAPNLTDDVWLYGSSAEDVEYTLRNGRNGVMPAQKTLLGDDRIRILAAYVRSLSVSTGAASGSR
ncbi:MAG: cytochrome-c oxidase, cbb3-type subunit III [Woeseiaceae bacterium]|jgi:cytochrome c oxidase cbb3-type subunit 3|nr:cytochrome-c oxidase, cbb3-type subunit III [Woeseiaceae bacterium]